MEWGKSFTLRFLEYYRQEPCLWNPSHEDYKRKEKLYEAWQRLCQRTGKTIAEIKRKKDSLMATFRAHMRRKKASIRSGAGDTDVYKPAWFAFNYMESFLYQVYDCQPPINVQDTIYIKNEIISQEYQDSDDTRLSESYRESENTVTLSTPQQHQQRQQNPLGIPHEPENQLLTNCEYQEDECDLYARLLARKLRKLPEVERQYLMHDIDGMVLSAMHGSRSRGSVP